MKTYDKLIFELSKPGRKGFELPEDQFNTNGLSSIPTDLLRKDEAELPEVSELGFFFFFFFNYYRHFPFMTQLEMASWFTSSGSSSRASLISIYFAARIGEIRSLAA